VIYMLVVLLALSLLINCSRCSSKSPFLPSSASRARILLRSLNCDRESLFDGDSFSCCNDSSPFLYNCGSSLSAHSFMSNSVFSLTGDGILHATLNDFYLKSHVDVDWLFYSKLGKMPGVEVLTTDSHPVRLSPQNAYSPRIHAIIQEARRLFADGTAVTNIEDIDLSLLLSKLGAIRPEDLGAERLSLLSHGQVGYVSLEDNTCFTIGAFFLAPGARIPLHDHPKMCVLSQLVEGAMHATSFDMDQSSNSDFGYLVDDGLHVAPCCRVLYPSSGGNLHSFSTQTGCIIVDVMSPPYDDMDGRECTYFSVAQVHDRIYKIIATPPPDDFEVSDLS